MPVLRILSAFMLVLMGLYVSGWWKVLAGLERIGARLWKYIQPVSQKLFPIKNPWLAVLVGALWGWLPCGLVYSTLVFALAQGNAMVSAWVMFAFGLGTMPAVLLGGMASEKIKSLMQSYSLRTMMGISLIGFGFWILYFAIQHSGHQHHHASVSPSMAKIPVLAVTN